MAFEILIDVAGNDELLEGVLLPQLFRNKLPIGVQSINIRNYQNEEFVVELEFVGNQYMRVAGLNWRRFVRAIDYPNTEKLHFRWVVGNTFEVNCFNNLGLQIREDDMVGDWLHSCLIPATVETFVQQELPHFFLFDLSNRQTERENTEVRINGPVHNRFVEVFYELPDSVRPLGHAAGFHGPMWNLFCCENNVEDGQILMFTKLGDKQYALHIFNHEGIGIDVTSLSDGQNEGEVDDAADLEFEPVDVQSNVMHNNHRCSHFQHAHNEDLPVFFKKIEQHNLDSNMMTIPKPFVRLFELQSYKRARLHFGHLLFRIKLKKRIDRRDMNDDKHVVMETNWSTVLEDTVLTKGKILRFQLNWQNCVIGQMLDFDIC